VLIFQGVHSTIAPHLGYKSIDATFDDPASAQVNLGNHLPCLSFTTTIASSLKNKTWLKVAQEVFL